VVRAQKLRTARPVNKNYRLLNILRNADVNKVGRPSSAVAELLLWLQSAAKHITINGADVNKSLYDPEVVSALCHLTAVS